jgi:hypothetical protein
MIGCFERAIPGPPEAVWARLTAVDDWVHWMPDVRWAVLEGTFDEGGYVTIRPVRGRQTAFRLAVDAPRRFGLGLSFGPAARVDRVFELSPNEAGTTLVYRVDAGGPLARWLALPIARRAVAAAPALLDALAASLA